MNNLNLTASILVTATLAFSCTVTRTVTGNAVKAPVPTQEQADSLFNSLVGVSDNARTFILETEESPLVFGIVPHPDSAKVSVTKLHAPKGNWEIASASSYPLGDRNLAFESYADSTRLREISGKQFFTFAVQRTDGSTMQRSVAAFSPDDMSVEAMTFTGRTRKSGTKTDYVGTSDRNVMSNAFIPQLEWANTRLEGMSDLVFMSEGEIMSKQAIEWWLEKNPKALTSASRITFGQLPAESSLVDLYGKQKKENGDKYYCAKFNTDEYTVIVSKNKSTGQYSLCWVEPVCKNKKTDRLLNSIYFSNGSYLTMFYYHGNKTYSYRLNLANGTLQR